jgi:hypothetical protein
VRGFIVEWTSARSDINTDAIALKVKQEFAAKVPAKPAKKAKAA